MTKQEIYKLVEEAQNRVLKGIEALKSEISVLEYENFVQNDNWTEALQRAIDEYEIVHIPEKETPYYIDKTIVIPSDRRIIADKNAVIKQLPDVKVLMLRNEHTKDGSKLPISRTDSDENISITGGIWEESYSGRRGYGDSGCYDEENSFYGVSTCMLFNNIKGLSLANMTFRHTAGFSVQVGDCEDAVMTDIRFDECFADGLHINGGTENILIRNVSGQVGDDLVALNMYDWDNSSVNFGSLRNVVCENLDLAENSPYKAMRIQPGIYTYEDGSKIDCTFENAVVKNVRGINTFKMYLQTPAYNIKEVTNSGEAGSMDNVYFEDIKIDLNAPIDNIEEYAESHPVLGSIAGFELGSRIKNLYFKNIDVTLYKEKFPMSFFLCIGPKSIRRGDTEIFDPYIESYAENLFLENVKVNGEKCDAKKHIHEIIFDDIYGDGTACAKGKIYNLEVL